LQSPFSERVRRFTILQPLAGRDFRLLFVGQSISLFGDQFYIVALPLLALKLTGSALALGTVFMVEGASRALFQLIGGAVSDRLSLRVILLVSNLVRAAITAVVCIVLAGGAIHLWHLYALSILFGVVDAFFYPAHLAVIPRLIESEELNAGNALMRGTNRLMGLVGPVTAGLLIYKANLAFAFGVDALSFIFSAGTIWLMRDPLLGGEASAEPSVGLLESIRQGLRYAWTDSLVRDLLIYTAVVEFAFVGPSTVGLAVMARQRFSVGGTEATAASSLGTMLSAFAAGMLVGMLLAGSTRTLRRRGRLVIVIGITLAIGLVLVGLATNLWAASFVFACIGLGGGLTNIIVLGWLQSKTEPAMLGRVMGLVMFTASLLEPLSYGLSGALADVNVTLMFALSGSMFLLASILSIVSPAIRTSD
jgi:MFS family permease